MLDAARSAKPNHQASPSSVTSGNTEGSKLIHDHGSLVEIFPGVGSDYADHAHAGRARRVAEPILLYARRILESGAPEVADPVRAYRAGYRPEQRREIERGLRPGGGLLGVTATSALELGIDIGDLDASVLVGFPGTIASVRQQAGRARQGNK